MNPGTIKGMFAGACLILVFVVGGAAMVANTIWKDIRG